MRIPQVTFAATMLAIVLFLPGCSPSSTIAEHQSAHPSTNVADSGFSSSDIMFAQMMIPHHRQAIDMSLLAQTRTTNPEILALADAIRSAQGPEIDQMSRWLTNAGASMDMGHSMHMDGVLSDDDMSALDRASGAEFDRLFLQGMIGHHQGAITMANMIVDSANPEVATLGKNIVISQSQEIELMKRLLNEL